MHPTNEQFVTDAFVELADTLASDYDIGDFLQLLVDRCGEILDVRACGVVLEGPGVGLQLAAANTEAMKALEDLELHALQGPCVDAYRSVEQVAAGDLREQADRWPQVVPLAVELGLLSVHALPVALRDDCIGALNLYREGTGAFHQADIRLAQAFAHMTAIGVLQQRRFAVAEERAEQLQGALQTRVLIEQAKGILAERFQLDPQRAFEAIRSHARTNNRRLREVCQEILDGVLAIRP